MARSIEAEVWERRPGILTAAAELVLIRLADSAGTDHRMVWIGEDTLVEDTRKDRSTVYDALYQLRELRIIRTVPEDEWPKEARRYASVVRQITPASEWAVIRQGGQDVVQVQDHSLGEWKTMSRRKKASARTTDKIDDAVDRWHESEGVETSLKEYLGQAGHNMSDAEYQAWAVSGSPTQGEPMPESENPAQSVGKSGPNQEQNQEQKDEETTSLPSRRSATKRRSRAKQAEEDQGLDPADVLFAVPSPAPDNRARRQPGPDTGPGMVDYFERTLRASFAGRRALAVPDAINRTALAKTLVRWVKSGTSPDTIRAWMVTYASDTVNARAPGAPAWKSFLASRAVLAAQAERQREADDLAIRHDPNHPDFGAYWGLTPEEASALVKPLEAA